MRALIATVAVALAVAGVTGAPPQDARAQLREALGGEAVLNGLQTIRARGTIKFKPNDDHFDIAVALPDRFVSIVRTLRRQDAGWSTEWAQTPGTWQPRLEPVLIEAGDAAHEEVVGFNGDVPLTSSRRPVTDPVVRARMLDGTHAKMAEVLLPLVGAVPSSYLVVARSEAHAIHFSAVGGREWRLELDPVTHLPSSMTWRYPLRPGAPAGATPVTVRTEFSDFRLVAGVRWPHRLVTQREGQPVEDATIQRYDVNVNLSDKLFRQ